MQPVPDSSDSASPLLFRHATPRVSASEMPGRYEPSEQLWMVETSRGLLPVVQFGDQALLDTNTSTRVRQEGADDDFSREARVVAELLDTRTLTKVNQEGVDDDMSTEEVLGSPRRIDALAELATKTGVQQESDDQISASGLLELETRSLNNQEGIDEDWPQMLFELQTKTFADVEEDDDCSVAH